MQPFTVGLRTALATLSIWQGLFLACGAQEPPREPASVSETMSSLNKSVWGLRKNGVFAGTAATGNHTAQAAVNAGTLLCVPAQDLLATNKSDPRVSGGCLCVSGVDDSNVLRLSSFKKLRFLILKDCRLKNLEPLRKYTTITSLHLLFGTDMSRASSADSYDWLTLLEDKRSESPATLKGLEALTNLRELTLYDADKITTVDDIGTLQRLEFLHLAYCVGLTDLSPLAELPRLRELHLERLTGIRDLDTNLPSSLESLTLSLMRNLTSLDAVAKLPQLKELTISCCPDVRDLTPLDGLTRLKRISLSTTGVTHEAQRAFHDKHPHCEFTGLDALPVACADSDKKGAQVDSHHTSSVLPSRSDGENVTRKLAIEDLPLEFPISSGETYGFSCEAKLITDMFPKPRSSLVALDRNKKIVAREDVYVTANEWTPYRVKITVPKSAASVTFVPDLAVHARNERLLHTVTGDAVTPVRVGLVRVAPQEPNGK